MTSHQTWQEYLLLIHGRYRWTDRKAEASDLEHILCQHGLPPEVCDPAEGTAAVLNTLGQKRVHLRPATERQLQPISAHQMDCRLRTHRQRLKRCLYGRTKPAACSSTISRSRPLAIRPAPGCRRSPRPGHLHSGAPFLDTLDHRLPFSLNALQVDGGGEFATAFEQTCQERSVKLFVLSPRSPKLNGQIERANRTCTEEFCEIAPFSLPLADLNCQLQVWEQTHKYGSYCPIWLCA